MAQEAASQQALLFIPDISGFTKFVGSTEISHSQHIIGELLETLMESNQLGLKVSEIEGDAILFYKTGAIPKPEEIAEQCKKMFIAFHQQLRKYDVARICNCGACSLASQLTLKMVAHQGEISFVKVREHEKLFGSDVILVHRLLKNDIPEHEYLLATEKISFTGINSATDKFSWLQLTKGSSTYDLGEVKYAFSPLKDLYKEVKDPEPPKIDIPRVAKPFIMSVDVKAPMAFVYSKLIDLKGRLETMPGVLRVDVQDEKHNQMNKAGTIHECVRESGSAPVQTAGANLSENKMIFTEIGTVRKMSFDYVVEKTGNETCKLTFEIHVLLKFPVLVIFNLMMKKKMLGEFQYGQSVIKDYCEKKYAEQKTGVKAAPVV